MPMEYRAITQVTGPLVFVRAVQAVAYNELVSVRLGDGRVKRGQVLETSEETVVVQLFEETSGIDVGATVRFLGETMKMPVSRDMLGRVLSGAGEPIDEGPPIIPEERRDVNGSAINPWARENPEEFIETGISAIDGMNTLVRGQKLPIFSGAGLPHDDIALQIARQANVLGRKGEFAVVFAGMGITSEEAEYFIEDFQRTGAIDRSVVFLNLGDDPAVERLITPRVALTTAEYLAFTAGLQVLVILTDMTNYCEALRQVSAARGEVPGRRGYPGYMYTDLASLYERAGRIKGNNGSITQIPILSMPGDDITHPVPDLTGYITEGQIVAERGLHMAGVYPPIDVRRSLSRQMSQGIGEGRTREDHKAISDQCFAAYARGRDLRGLMSIVGKEALSAKDRKYLEFADLFESEIISQGKDERRTIGDTLGRMWKAVAALPVEELTRIDEKYIGKYHPSLQAEVSGAGKH